MHPIRSRYLQVAWTYTRPLPHRILAVFLIAFLIFIFCVREANFGTQFVMLILGGSLAAWSGPLVAAHLKEQMADSRSRLTPGYRAPHLLVAALVFALGVAGVTCVTAIRLWQTPTTVGWPTIALSLPGFAAVIVLAAMLLAWMAHSQSPTFIFTVLGLGGGGFFLHGQEWARQIIAGERPTLAWGILAASIAALGALWWRLTRMHEEMPEYWRFESFNTRLHIAMTGDRHMRRAAAAETGWLNELVRGAARLNQLPNISAARFWRRVQHWRLVIGNVRADWSTALFLAAAILGIYFLVPDRSRDTQFGMFVVIPIVISLCIPILLTGTMWPHRWFMLAGESLRPSASRETFLREQGTAMGLEVANLWFWFTLGAFIPGLIFQPKWILSPHVSGGLLLTAAAQVWLFGVCVWVLHLRMSWFLNFAAALLSVAAAGAIVAWQMSDTERTMIRTPSPIWAVVMVVAGVVLTWDAYRRWKVTDLD